MSSLAQSFDIIAPSLNAPLVSAEALELLRRRAATLAPIHRAGFECRLDALDPRVDLQQCVMASEGDVAPLRRFIRAGGAGATGDALAGWELLERFCARWEDADSPLHQTITELWLECDLPVEGGAGTPPSVFGLLHPRDGGAGASVPLAKEFLRALLERELPTALERTLDRCGSACPAGSRISHVGVMLGRETHGIRIHVTRLPVRELVAYLGAVGWQGDAEPIRAHADWMLELCDQVVLCLDVASVVLPHIGLEAFISPRRGIDLRWEPLISRLVSRGICSPEKAGVLREWAGRSTPQTARSPWPDALLAESLIHPPEQFTALDRRLSHIKFTFTPAVGAVEPPPAKAYFGYAHSIVTRRAAVNDRTTEPADDRACDPAIATDRAIRFLLAARNQAGWWRDFHDIVRHATWRPGATAYPSDEWVTAYVGSTLASLSDARADAAAREAWETLCGRRGPDGGWGYFLLMPHDVDSTAWALRLASRIGMADSPRALSAAAFVSGRQVAGGGFPTFDGAELEARWLSSDTREGWCAPHTCVTAAVATISPNESAIEYLLSHQHEDGRWSAHWWEDDEYATALAVEALITHEVFAAHPDVRDAVRRGARWAASRIGPSGAVHSRGLGGDSEFATALAIHALAIAGPTNDERRQLERAVRWLTGKQFQDGSFSPSARMFVPALSILDPHAHPERTDVYLDRERIFTTATVLRALAASKLSSRAQRGSE